MRNGFKVIRDSVATDVHGHSRENYLEILGVSFPINTLQDFDAFNREISSHREKKEAFVRFYIILNP